jgi:hypothetical protein
MKYIYKGMGMPGWGDVSGSVLLGWHEKVCDPCILPIYVHAKDTPTVDGSSGNGLHCTSNDRSKDRVTIALSIIQCGSTSLCYRHRHRKRRKLGVQECSRPQ